MFASSNLLFIFVSSDYRMYISIPNSHYLYAVFVRAGVYNVPQRSHMARLVLSIA